MSPINKLTQYITACVINGKGITLKELRKVVARNQEEGKTWTEGIDVSPEAVSAQVHALFTAGQVELVEWRLPGINGVVGTLVLPKDVIVMCAESQEVEREAAPMPLDATDIERQRCLDRNLDILEDRVKELEAAATERDTEVDAQVAELENALECSEAAKVRIAKELAAHQEQPLSWDLSGYFEGFVVTYSDQTKLFTEALAAQSHAVSVAEEHKPSMFGLVPIDLQVYATVRSKAHE